MPWSFAVVSGSGFSQVQETGELQGISRACSRIHPDKISPLHLSLRSPHAFTPPLPQNPHTLQPRTPPATPTHAQTGHMLSKSPPFPQRCTANGHVYLGDQGVLCGRSPIICLFVFLQVTGRSFFTLSRDSTSRQAGSAILFQGLHVLQTSLSL